MSMLRWLKWFFYDCRVCPHTKSFSTLEDLGRTKVEWCDNCGKCLKVI